MTSEAINQQTELPDAVLLGAGASVEAGVPASRELASSLIRHIGQQPGEAVHRAALEYVWSRLQAGAKQRELVDTIDRARLNGQWETFDPNPSSLDVELLMRAVDSLAHRTNLEISPFVNAWDPALTLLEAPTGPLEEARDVLRVLGDEIKSALQSSISGIVREAPWGLQSALDQFREGAHHGRTGSSEVVREISSAIAKSAESVLTRIADQLGSSHGRLATSVERAVAERSRFSAGGVTSDLRRILEHMLVQSVWSCESKRVCYLKPMLSHATSQSPITIFSLNYDNAVEIAAADLGLHIDYGWEPGTGQRGVRFDERHEVRLVKLHGSANWGRMRMATRRSSFPTPTQSIRLLDDAAIASRNVPRAIIFGGGSKLSAEFPFFDLFLYFRDELQKKRLRHLLIVGYSGRDEHINTLIRRRFNEDDLKVTIVDRDDPNLVQNRILPGVDVPDRSVSLHKLSASDGIAKVFPAKT